MAIEYFNAYHSYLKSIEPLDDAERGRLFTACLEYSMTGTSPELCRNERFVFPTIKAQIDRDVEKYKAKCGKNAQNVSLRWKQNDTTVYDRIPSNTNAYETYQGKGKGKGKDKGEGNISNDISPDLQSGNVFSLNDCFDKTYEIYPRKEGKAKGKANYINYLTKGRSISGQGRIKLNHQQIYIAVQAYAAAVCGTETRYIKNFEAFTNSTLLDYIEQTQEAYEAWMFEKYGNDWKGVKFTYH